MPNTFVFDPGPQLTNIITEIHANEAKIDLIRGTDLPAIVAEVDANEAILDLIRSTDVPNIQTNIDANETKIDSIIAAIPQNVRGDFSVAYHSHDSAAWTDTLNLTDTSGKLYSILVTTAGTVSVSQIQITLDSTTSAAYTLIAYGTALNIYNTVSGTQPLNLTEDATNIHYFNLEFSSILHVQTRVNTGPGTMDCRVVYALDNF